MVKICTLFKADLPKFPKFSFEYNVGHEILIRLFFLSCLYPLQLSTTLILSMLFQVSSPRSVALQNKSSVL